MHKAPAENIQSAEALPSAIFLMGPTASGKTELALALGKYLPLDIISVDSSMVYRGMDIGTAKPRPEILAQHPHRLVDIAHPSEGYTVARFRDDALREMRQITASGRIPLLVGGTMLYFNALEHGLAPLPPADEALRVRLRTHACTIGWQGLHAQLNRVDSASASRIHPNDRQRIERALEVYYLTGHPLSHWLGAHEQPLQYQLCKLLLWPDDRASLHEAIARRFERMLEQGLLAEVARLLATPGVTLQSQGLRCIGYRQMAAHLSGTMSHEESVIAAVAATRQLAKRQITWLRRQQYAHRIFREQTVGRIVELIGQQTGGKIAILGKPESAASRL